MILPLILAAALTADTSRPNSSMYAFGERVDATFAVKGLKPGEARTLEIDVVDEHDRTVEKLSKPVAADAKGEWSGTFRMPSARMGFFRVRANAGDGLSLPKRGSRPAGCFTYAVMPDPAKRVAPAEEDAFMGHMGENVGEAKIARWIGSRMSFAGDNPSPTPEAAAKRRAAYEKNLAETGYVTYGGYVTAFHDLRALRPFYTPEGKEWLKAHKFKRIWDIFSIEDGERHFRDAIPAFTRAAREQLPPGRKQLLLEFFSEPDLTSPNPEVIVQCAKAVWESVQSVDKDALVIQPGLSTIIAQGYHQRLFELGLGKYMNAFHVHPYTPFPPEPNGFLRNVRNLKRMVREATGRPDTPLFALEAGYPTTATLKGELLQMNGEVRRLLILLGEGFRYNCVFYSSDYGDDAAGSNEGDYGMTYNLKLKEKRFGTDCVSPRPLLPALAAFSWMLDGYRPVACIDYLGETALGYAYRNRKGECRMALWDYAGARTVEIPVGRARVRTADIFANETERETNDGILTLELGPSPVYVIDVDPGIWGAKNPVVSASEDGRVAVAGGRLEVKGAVARAGVLEIRPAAATGLKAVTKKVDKGAFSESFDLAESTPGGEYPMMLALRDGGGRLLSVSGYRVTVDPPVRMGAPEPVFEGGVPGVAVTAENLTGERRDVVLESRIRGVPEARRRASRAIAPHSSAKVTLLFDGWEPNPFDLCPTEVSAVSKGVRTVREKELNYLGAARLPGVGKGGDFSAWKPVLHKVPENLLANAKCYTGPDDLSVSMACGWNDDYLLFAFDVEDDAFMQERHGWLTWWGDSVQLGLARDILEKTTANQFTDLVSQAVTETTFALTSTGPEVYRTHTFDEKRLPAGTSGSGDKGRIDLSECPFSVTRENTHSGVVVRYRMAIPWKYLEIDAPTPGRSVYFAASVNDVDPDSKACLMYGIFQLKQSVPKRFGRIVLSP